MCSIGGSETTSARDILFFVFNQDVDEEVEFEEEKRLFGGAKLNLSLRMSDFKAQFELVIFSVYSRVH